MSFTKSDYRFAKPLEEFGDSTFTGNFLPSRSGDAKKQLRYEDILFLEEAALELEAILASFMDGRSATPAPLETGFPKILYGKAVGRMTQSNGFSAAHHDMIEYNAYRNAFDGGDKMFPAGNDNYYDATSYLGFSDRSVPGWRTLTMGYRDVFCSLVSSAFSFMCTNCGRGRTQSKAMQEVKNSIDPFSGFPGWAGYGFIPKILEEFNGYRLPYGTTNYAKGADGHIHTSYIDPSISIVSQTIQVLSEEEKYKIKDNSTFPTWEIDTYTVTDNSGGSVNLNSTHLNNDSGGNDYYAEWVKAYNLTWKIWFAAITKNGSPLNHPWDFEIDSLSSAALGHNGASFEGLTLPETINSPRLIVGWIEAIFELIPCCETVLIPNLVAKYPSISYKYLNGSLVRSHVSIDEPETTYSGSISEHTDASQSGTEFTSLGNWKKSAELGKTKNFYVSDTNPNVKATEVVGTTYTADNIHLQNVQSTDLKNVFIDSTVASAVYDLNNTIDCMVAVIVKIEVEASKEEFGWNDLDHQPPTERAHKTDAWKKTFVKTYYIKFSMTPNSISSDGKISYTISKSPGEILEEAVKSATGENDLNRILFTEIASSGHESEFKEEPSFLNISGVPDLEYITDDIGTPKVPEGVQYSYSASTRVNAKQTITASFTSIEEYGTISVRATEGTKNRIHLSAPTCWGIASCNPKTVAAMKQNS